MSDLLKSRHLSFGLISAEKLLRQTSIKTEFITVTSPIGLCPDTKDNFLLSLAIDGKATHILTGDKDLLVLHNLKKTRILTISEYLEAF